MRISISNKEVSIDKVTYNDGLNYGRFDSNEIEVFPYEYCMKKHEFVSLMSHSYAECLKEIRRDDIHCNETSAFSEMNYVDINSAFEHPKALGEAIETFFVRELFEKALGYKDTCEFILNSTEKVEVSNDEITIIGRCFRRK